jgi:hypothetical protein
MTVLLKTRLEVSPPFRALSHHGILERLFLASVSVTRTTSKVFERRTSVEPDAPRALDSRVPEIPEQKWEL